MANRDFGMRLQRLRNIKGFSIRQLGRQANLSSSYLSKLEHGLRTPKLPTLKKIARGLRVPYSELLKIAGYAPKIPDNAIIPHGYVKIPVVGDIPCGDPNTAVRETNQYKLIPSVDDYADMIFLRADGHSMEPKIKDKSLVKIHLQTTIENEEIAAVSVNGSDATLKQVEMDYSGRIVKLHAINPTFKDIYPTPDMRCKIIGKAVAVENPL